MPSRPTTDFYDSYAARLRFMFMSEQAGRVEVVVCPGGACCSLHFAEEHESGLIVREMTAAEAAEHAVSARKQAARPAMEPRHFTTVHATGRNYMFLPGHRWGLRHDEAGFLWVDTSEVEDSAVLSLEDER